LGCAIRQLLDEAKPDSLYLNSVKRLRTEHEYAQSPSEPALARFLSELQSLSQPYRPLYIIIDGLDECENREDLLNILSKLANNDTINLLLTSRGDRQFREIFGKMRDLKIGVDNTREDISTHVDYTLSNCREFQNCSIVSKSAIRNHLLQNHQGMYATPVLCLII
jgi:hypothetical protein